MPLSLIETTVKGPLVRMRFADNADPAQATQWIDFQVATDKVDPSWHLAAVHREALQSVQDALNSEIQDARSVLNRVRD